MKYYVRSLMLALSVFSSRPALAIGEASKADAPVAENPKVSSSQVEPSKNADGPKKESSDTVLGKMAPEKAAAVNAYISREVDHVSRRVIEFEHDVHEATQEFGHDLLLTEAAILRMTAVERLQAVDQLIHLLDEAEKIVVEQPDNLRIARVITSIVTVATVIAFIRSPSRSRAFWVVVSTAATSLVIQSIRDKQSVLKHIPKFRASLVKLRQAIAREILVSKS